MAKARKLAMFVGGFVAAGSVAITAASSQPAKAAGQKSAGLTVVSNNFNGGSNMPANTILQMTFSDSIDPTSVSPATVLVRGQNSTLTGYTKQAFGSYQVVGNVIRFYPRLPTHLRDATGKFYPQGSTQDDAAANAGFHPSTGYEVRLVGRPHVTTVQSTAGRPLPVTMFGRFSIAAALPAEQLWTTQSYSDSPPPQFQFSNPPDTPPSSATQYATHGGTQDVPNSIMASLFCTKVPLASGTVRDSGNVELTMLSRKGDYSLRRPVSGSVFLEQNFDTTLVAFQPKVALADLGTYGVRVTKSVKDLTEQNDFSSNHARDVLNQLYVFLSSARALAPGTPIAQLPDPNAILIPDWPSNKSAGGPAARGVLKTNLLALGDTYKDEIDPRMMLIFTTRDEPVTSDQITVEFTKLENLYDATLSIGTVDVDVPSAAAAVFTASGGSGALGDLTPASNVTYSPNQALYPNGIFNFRNLVIPAGVTVTFTGSALPSNYTTSPPTDTQNPPRQAARSYPVTIKCLTFQLDGTITVDGSAGYDGDRTNTSANYSATTGFVNKPGGPGGPGGGNGGYVTTASSAGSSGGTGDVGNDANLVPATAVTGGRGGIGGSNHTNTIYSLSGGGGGGGQRTAGAAGGTGTYPTASWNGPGGAGGAAATGNTDLASLVGGAGGGGGGPGTAAYYGWGASSGTGGGGGGALMIQTASTLKIGAAGIVRSKGGKGGWGMQSAGPPAGGGAGGGGGGSVLLRSSRGFSLSNQLTAVDVSGGAGGAAAPYSSYYSGAGGAGGSGFIKFEDPNGGITTPTSLAGGVYSPAGGGVPSYVYTKWLDLGVQDPRIVTWSASSFLWANTNDSIYIQVQMTRENPTIFGKPDTSAIKASDQTSTNTVVMSQWQPIFVSDRTGIPGGAFTATMGAIPGYPVNPPTEYTGFDVSPLNGKAYRFIRFRMFFQLDATQTQTSAVPYVDRIVTKFEYNF